MTSKSGEGIYPLPDSSFKKRLEKQNLYCFIEGLGKNNFCDAGKVSKPKRKAVMIFEHRLFYSQKRNARRSRSIRQPLSYTKQKESQFRGSFCFDKGLEPIELHTKLIHYCNKSAGHS